MINTPTPVPIALVVSWYAPDSTTTLRRSAQAVMVGWDADGDPVLVHPDTGRLTPAAVHLAALADEHGPIGGYWYQLPTVDIDTVGPVEVIRG